jgi:hypothetical protein
LKAEIFAYLCSAFTSITQIRFKFLSVAVSRLSTLL